MDIIANGLQATQAPPEVLRRSPRWVCWRYGMRDGEPTKFPVDPKTGESASSTDPLTWATFEQAVARVGKGRADGVGIVLGEARSGIDAYDGNLAGVDIDECRDPETGELTAWARSVIEAHGSYAEYSPSGGGAHILGYGRKPGTRSKKNLDHGGAKSIELYDHARYLTVTGIRIDGTPAEPKDITEPLADHYEQMFDHAEESSGVKRGPGNDLPVNEVIERMLDSANGEKIGRLMDGDTSDYGGDHSRADLALTNHLCWWTYRDPEKIDLIFRRSRLMRPKWDERHYDDGRTYGEGTIDKALMGTHDYYTPLKETLRLVEPPEDTTQTETRGLPGKVSIADVVEHGVKEPPQLIPGVLYKGNVHNWYGEPGCGKTFLALWAAIQVMQRGEAAVYLDEEGNGRMMAERLNALGANTTDLRDLFHYYQRPGLTCDTANLLIETVEDTEPSLVIFDSWMDYLSLDGRNENDPTEVLSWIKNLCDPLKERDITVLLLDHVGKDLDKGPRGASSKKGAVEVQAAIRKKEPFDRNHTGEVTLSLRPTHAKDREAALDEYTTFAIGGDGTGSIRIVRNSGVLDIKETGGLLSPKEQKALGTLGEKPIRFSDWKALSGVSSSTLDRLVKKARNEGLIGQDENGYYFRSQDSPGTPTVADGSPNTPTTL